MKTVILEVEDNKFNQFMTMINLLRSDVIKKLEVENTKYNEEIDEQHCLKVLDKINRGDYTAMKKVSADELLKELEI